LSAIPVLSISTIWLRTAVLSVSILLWLWLHLFSRHILDFSDNRILSLQFLHFLFESLLALCFIFFKTLACIIYGDVQSLSHIGDLFFLALLAFLLIGLLALCLHFFVFFLTVGLHFLDLGLGRVHRNVVFFGDLLDTLLLVFFLQFLCSLLKSGNVVFLLVL